MAKQNSIYERWENDSKAGGSVNFSEQQESRVTKDSDIYALLNKISKLEASLNKKGIKKDELTAISKQLKATINKIGSIENTTEPAIPKIEYKEVLERARLSLEQTLEQMILLLELANDDKSRKTLIKLINEENEQLGILNRLK